MKKKLFFMPIMVAGFIYFLFNMVEFVFMSATKLVKLSIPFSVLLFIAYTVLAISIALHLFKPLKLTAFAVWCACIIFTSVLFINNISNTVFSLNFYIQGSNDFVQAPAEFLKIFHDTLLFFRLRIAAYSILLACSVFTFGTLAVREIYRMRPVKAV